jgi:hypothetical protein
MLDTNVLQTKTVDYLVHLIKQLKEFVPKENLLNAKCKRIVQEHDRAIDQKSYRIGLRRPK